MIPQDIIDKVNDLDIVSVFEKEGIELKRQGASRVCCCPIHNEKTPSCHVNAARNSWKCFGCGKGGNAITFIMEFKKMRFPEAVAYLAKEFGLHYEEREQTPEEKERAFQEEKLHNVNNAALAFFRNQLKNSPGAQDYCKKRGWDENILDEFNVGYAPKGNTLIKHLRQLGWKEEILIEAGLAKTNQANGSVYDSFRERIIFPIYKKDGRVCGFSGRYVGHEDDVPKYLNTSETPIFKKGHLLFGFFQGGKDIATEETVFLVEGNPDVIRLHSIGKRNTVAPCGTALTVDQIHEIKKKANTVVIIGDTDNAGVKAVEKNGEMLLKEGLNVRVMTLPEGKDPDEYFLTHQHDFDECYSKSTYDYIPWIAGRKLEGKNTQSEILEVVKSVAMSLAYCKNETAVEMYLNEFTSKRYKGGAIWRVEYSKAKTTLERKSLKAEGSEDMAATYGFFIKDNCYWGSTEKGGNKRWSNFILQPILHIRDEKNARRIFLIKNSCGQDCTIKMSQSELVSFTDFKTRTESAGNFVWEAGLPELTTLKKYLYNNTPSADEIKQLGWQKKYNFFAWGNGGLADGHFEKVDKFGIVTIGGKKFYLPGCAMDTQDNTQGYQFERKFIFAQTNDITLKEFSSKLINVFGDNAKIGLAFLIATLFKDIIVNITTSFPILNLFGPKGTGKTQMGAALMSFFIPENKAINVNNATKAGLAEAVAEVANALVHLDEYKNNMDLDRREFLKGLWDGAGRSKMDMDNDKKRVTTSVDCGVIMSGQEMPTADIALFNRLIFLTFTKSEFSDQERRNFQDLERIEKRGLTHLTSEILSHRNKFQNRFRGSWDDALTDLNEKVHDCNIEERTLRNWATVLAAYHCIEQFLDIPVSYTEMLEICANGCKEQNSKTLQNNELSSFWNTLEVLVTSRQIWGEVDYKIKPGDGKERKILESKNSVVFADGKNYLFMSFNRIVQLYRKAARESDVKSITPESLKFYLEHSAEFMGTVKSERFRVPDTPQGYSAMGQGIKSRVTTAMVFDYGKIQDKYGIDINIMTEQPTVSVSGNTAPAQEEIPGILFQDDN